MKELTKKEIEKIIEVYKGLPKEERTIDETSKLLKSKIDKFWERKAVLGLDIYKYSQYPFVAQSLIPHLFRTLYEMTIRNCLKAEPYVFQFYPESKDFTDNFIDTGDGGFQIFNNPFDAIIFSIYFQTNIKRYNTGKLSSTEYLKPIIGKITMRYSLTFDNIFHYSSNYYGPAIVNNARIIAKDKLNRFLIDESTFDWFTENFSGIENIQSLYPKDFAKINLFKDYLSKENKGKFSSVLFNGSREIKKEVDVTEGNKTDETNYKVTDYLNDQKNNVLNVDILSIGEIKSKTEILSIHSLHIQVLIFSEVSKPSILTTSLVLPKLTISVGNLNTTGITE